MTVLLGPTVAAHEKEMLQKCESQHDVSHSNLQASVCAMKRWESCLKLWSEGGELSLVSLIKGRGRTSSLSQCL